MKPKTLRRLLLLGAFAGVIALGGTGFVLLRQYQNSRTTQRLRNDGMAAFERGDFPVAVDTLGRYLNRNNNDAQALLNYARARLQNEAPDGRHFVEALAVFRKYLALMPDDKAVLREALDAYLAAGFLQETAFYSQKLRPEKLDNATQDDLPVLRIEAAALLAMKPPDHSAPDILARLSQLAPLDVEWQLRYAGHLSNLHRDAEVRTMVDRVQSAHATDPRATLIALLAPVDTSLDANARDLFPRLCGLAGLSPTDASRVGAATFPDAPFALRLADAFDRLGRFEHALATLEAAAPTATSPDLTRVLANRLWQVGRPDDVIRVVGDLSPLCRGRDIDLIALKALSLKQTNRANEAETIRANLASRTGEFRAIVWSSAIAASQPAPGSNLLELEKALALASPQLPREPIIAFIHAEILATLGRIDQAVGEWDASTQSLKSQGWAMPWIRLSQSSLQSGDLRSAVEQANMAIAQSPRAVQAGMARFSALVAVAVASRGNRPELPDLITFADAITSATERLSDKTLAKDLREEVGVARVLLHLRAGQREAAIVSIEGLLNSTTPPSRRAMERLALASALEELGLEEKIVAGIEKAYGSAPSTAAVRAVTLRLAGRKDEGFALLRSGADGSNAPDRAAWDVQIATFLDAAKDPAAGPAWAALADAHPTNMVLQRQALNSPSACQDQNFVERTTKRFAEGTGAAANQELLLRVAKARSMMTAQMSPLRRDEVVATLRSIILDRPSLVDARLLLADALLLNDPARGIQPDLEGAVVELRAAAQASESPQLRLRAAALLQDQRNFGDARAQLLSIWKESKGEATLGRRVAEMLVAQGDNVDAVPVLLDLVSLGGTGASPDLLIFAGTVVANATGGDEAAILLRRAAEHPAIRPDQVPEVAAALTRLGRVDTANAALARLDAEKSPARRALLRARFHELTGNYPQAERGYDDAIKADPNFFGAWAGLLDCQLHEGDVDGAKQVLSRVTQALPNEPDLRLLKQRVLLASGVGGSDDLRVLADILAADPARASEAQAVRAVDALRRQNKLDDPESLLDLAQKFPGSLPVQLFTTRRLLVLTPPRTDDASRLATRAMTAFPTDAEAARLAARIFAAQGRWSQTISACRAWKDRDPASSFDPDAAIAEAYLALQRPSQAALQLRPHLPFLLASLDKPDRLRALAILARAQLASGQAPEALSLLRPAIASSAAFRNDVWLRLAASETPDEPTANAWIKVALASMSDSNADDQIALASAWSMMAERFPDSTDNYATKSLALLRTLTASEGTSSAAVLELLGATYQRAGQIPEAIDAFHRAIAVDPNRPSALANLANVYIRNNEIDEAIKLADRALRIAGDDHPSVAPACADVFHRAGVLRCESSDGESLLSRAASISKQLAIRDMGNSRALMAYAQTAADVGAFADVAEANSLILDLPTLPAQARAIAKNNLAYGLARARSSTRDLARAETLAREVQAQRQDQASLQTLAVVLSAQGQRDEATRLFRSLLKKDAKQPSVLIALAMHLATGGEPQRQEARSIVRELADLPGMMAQCSPQDKRDLSHLRGRLVPSSAVDGPP